MPKAIVRFLFTQLNGRNFLFLETLRESKTPVSKDMEDTIDTICQKLGINPVETIILFDDGNGIWDAYNFSTKKFISIYKTNQQEAAKKYISIEHEL